MLLITEVETLQGPCEVSALGTSREHAETLVRELHQEARSNALRAAGLDETTAAGMTARAVWNVARRAQALAKAAEILQLPEQALRALATHELRATVEQAHPGRAVEMLAELEGSNPFEPPLQASAKPIEEAAEVRR